MHLTCISRVWLPVWCVVLLYYMYWLSSLQRDYNNYSGDIWPILTQSSPTNTLHSPVTSTILFWYIFWLTSSLQTQSNKWVGLPFCREINLCLLLFWWALVICTFSSAYNTLLSKPAIFTLNISNIPTGVISKMESWDPWFSLHLEN